MARAQEDRCCIKRDGVSDTSRTLFGNLLTAASIASAAYNSSRAVTIATKEWEMARKYWQIAENWLNYYKDSYAPVEDKELAEARKLKTEKPLYTVARGRMRVAAWLQFRGAISKATRCMSKYCTGAKQDVLADLIAAQANAVAISDGLGYRNERAYIEVRDDERFKRQFETAKRGRNLLSNTVSMGVAAANIYGNLYQQAWSGIENAGEAIGYFGARHSTQTPYTVIPRRQ